MFAHDLISITDIREKTKQVKKTIDSKNYPCPVLSNNKIQFYIMSETEYIHYKKIMKIMEIDHEVQEAKTNGPHFASADDLLADLMK